MAITRVAALYDIHGNAPALEAVLAEVRALGVDRVVVGGDVALGPMPIECLALLRSLDVPVDFLAGNCDTAVVAQHTGTNLEAISAHARVAVAWLADELPPADIAWFATWPLTVRLAIDGLGDVLFCHATPRNNPEVFTKLTPEAPLRPIFEDTGADVVVCGHTHMQFDRTIGKVRVVNSGSIGMPIGEASAHWLLLGPGVQFRRTSYDLAAAAARIAATRYPQRTEFAQKNVLRPPAEDELLPQYEGMALKA
jgi:predicted phosphodiesterase